MKKIFIIGTILIHASYSNSLSKENINSMVSKIKEERTGINISELETTTNPFVLREAPTVEENLTIETASIKIVSEPIYILEAILNNAAFINNKWYKKGNKLDLYTVINISKTIVTLDSLHGKKTLSLKKKKLIKLH